MSVSSTSEPVIPDDISVGSSVSTRLQDEYEELLKYAVVVPKLSVDNMPKVLTDRHRSFAQGGMTAKEYERMQEVNEELHEEGSVVSEEQNERQVSFAEPSMPIREPTSLSARDDYYLNSNNSAVDNTLTRSTMERTLTTHGIGLTRHVAHTPPTPSVPSTSGLSPLPYMGVHEGRKSPFMGEAERRSPYIGMALQGMDREEHAFDQAAEEEGGLDQASMEAKLDLWCRNLKSNILEEIARMSIRSTEQNRMKLCKGETRHIGEMRALHSELESMRELLSTYEVTLERKDGVVANLTRSLQNQRERYEVLKNFTAWKVNYFSHKQEGYGLRVAARHHEHVLKRKCWAGWYSIIVDRWKKRVEKACQAKAQDVCISLTNDYEARLNSANEALEAAREEVSRLHQERESYEETMKKAFMRGVCALNVEAMNIFQEGDDAASSACTSPPAHSEMTDGEDLLSELGGGPYTVQHRAFGGGQGRQLQYQQQENRRPAPTAGFRHTTRKPSSTAPQQSQMSRSMGGVTTATRRVEGRRLTTKITAGDSSSVGGVAGSTRGVVGGGHSGPASSAPSVLVERHSMNNETMAPPPPSQHSGSRKVMRGSHTASTPADPTLRVVN